MRMANKNKTTKHNQVALQKIAPMPPSNVILTLTLLQKKGGEMYGM
jgi:hypothetical protein